MTRYLEALRDAGASLKPTAETWACLTWALVIGVAVFAALLFLTGCGPADLVCWSEAATDGGPDLQVCQRFPASPVVTP